MPEDKPSFSTELKNVVESKLDEFGLNQTDYVKAALQWQYNWIGLAGAAAFALVSGTGLPLVLAAGLELMYVALVPQSSRFRRLVRSWKYADEKRAHEMQLNEMYTESARRHARALRRSAGRRSGHPRQLLAALLDVAGLRQADGRQADRAAAGLRAPALHRARAPRVCAHTES